MDISQYELLIFDLDGTLAEFQTGKILPNVQSFFDKTDLSKHKLALASNQGGVGLHYWMKSERFGNPDNYPTVEQIDSHIGNILAELGHEWLIYVSYAYQSRKSQRWSPIPIGVTQYKERWSIHWCKPNAGMLLQAMNDTGIPASKTLMIGDWEEDRIAAERALVDFVQADVFFTNGENDNG